MSRIGVKPITVPAGVEVTIAEGNLVTVKGPKGTLTKKFDAAISIKQEETICFGDGQNDIVMSQVADIVVAMKRSHQMLKNVATSVCEDVFEHGIYKELKRRSII